MLTRESPAVAHAQPCRLHAGKQAKLVKEGWGDDAALQTAALNRHYDASLYEGYPKHVRVNLARVDESAIDFDLLEDLVRHIDKTQDEGAILVFLPGMGEIMGLVDRLRGSHLCAPYFVTTLSC
jgi:HrpA-like RNA helicase